MHISTPALFFAAPSALFSAAPSVFSTAIATVAPLPVVPATLFCAAPPVFTTAQYAALGNIFSRMEATIERMLQVIQEVAPLTGTATETAGKVLTHQVSAAVRLQAAARGILARRRVRQVLDLQLIQPRTPS